MRKSKKSAENLESDSRGPEKKVRTAPTNTSLLPPCKVCLEPAAGFHYGVNTCEACKGFFRRSLLRKEEYKCIGNGKCSIQAGKRKICPKCRHDKCLAVGMSTGAIKTGRYTHAKRTQDILEYKQMVGLPPDFSTDTSTTTTTSTIVKPLSPKCTTSSSSQWAQSSELTAASSGILLSVTDSASSPETLSVASPSLKVPQSAAGSLPCSHPQAGAVASSSLNSISPFNGKFDLPSPLTLTSIADTVLDNLVEGQGRSDEVVSPWSVLSSPSASSSLSVSSPPSVKPSPAAVAGGDDLDDEECQRIIQQLVEAHDRIILTFKFTPEEFLEKQRACAETCRLRTEMFGPLKQLSEEEYQDIYQQTGLDVDGRQSFLTNLSQNLDDSIRRYTAFVKSIPGFSQLSIKDQIKLIKDNRCEVGMLSMYQGYNHELKVVTMFSGRTFCVHEFMRFAGSDLAHQRFEAAKTIQQLGLSLQEAIVVKSMAVVTCGHEDLDEPERVSEIQWKLGQCLLWLLKQSRPDPNLSFARIISALCTLRTLTARFYEWIKSNPFEHYSQFKDNALLVEWFSNS